MPPPVQIALALKTTTSKAITVSVGTTTAGTYVEGACFSLNGSDGLWGSSLIWASTYLAANPILSASAFNTIRGSYGDTAAATISLTIAST